MATGTTTLCPHAISGMPPAVTTTRVLKKVSSLTRRGNTKISETSCPQQGAIPLLRQHPTPAGSWNGTRPAPAPYGLDEKTFTLGSMRHSRDVHPSLDSASRGTHLVRRNEFSFENFAHRSLKNLFKNLKESTDREWDPDVGYSRRHKIISVIVQLRSFGDEPVIPSGTKPGFIRSKIPGSATSARVVRRSDRGAVI